MRSAAALVLGLLVAAALPAPAATVTFNVDDATEAPDTNTADGVCHTASNTCSLLAALQQATAPSANTFVINLKAATYSVSATLPTINTTITIQSTDAATRNIQSASPGHPLLFNVVMGGNLTLDNVTVSNAGHGAISIVDGSASITNSVVTGNTQGAVYVNSSQTPSTLVLTNDTFSDNTNAIGPGALEVSFANIVATNVTFQGNTGTVGGVAYLHGSSDYTQTFTGCTFSGNSTIQSGGALWITASKVTIDTSTFDDNTASGGLYGGGAIYGGGPAPGTVVTNSTFTSNHADNASGGNGGAIFALNVVRATNCTFSGNQSTKGLGGAVFAGANDGAEFDAVNCTFSGNKAAGGGALAGGGASGILKLSNVTIAGNTATDTVAHGFGGGGTYGAMQPRNSIVAGNTSAGGAPDCIGNFASQGYTMVGNSTDCTVNSVGSGDKIGTGASPIDPHLGSLKDNGGPTATMALLAASPAGDAGDPAGCKDHNGVAIATDQRGQPRTVDGNSDGVARCDLGAYEAAVGTFPSPTTTTTTTTTTSTSTTTSTTTTTRPSTTTTTKPSTTSTTRPSTTTTSTTTSTTSTTTSLASTTTTTSTTQPTTTSTTLPPADACGGCDFDDPGCCQVTAPMAISTARLQPGHLGPIGGFGLRAKLAMSGFTGVDPRQDDVIVQLSTADGQLLCATIPHSLWRSGNGKRFKFADHSGSAAGGATKGRVTVDKNGGVTLTIVGHGLDPARFSPGLGIATRIGGRCSVGAAQLKAKHNRLIFP